MKIGFLRFEEYPGPRTRYLSLYANFYDVDFFYFTPSRIDVERKIIKGLYFDKDAKSFIEKETAYPDVIDDAPMFRYRYPELFNELLESGVFWFPPLGGKRKMYDVIKAGGHSKYLIETYNYQDIDIREMLQKHGALILKPNRSGQGQNIYKLKFDEELFHLHFEHNTETLSPEEFKSFTEAKFNNTWLVQNFIDSTTSQGNPFDVRVNTRRGKDGAWALKKMFIRIGNVNGVVSNIARGGSIGYYVDKFLEYEFGSDWKRIYSELISISRVLPDVLQKGYDYLLDDLGFDVGINRANGNELKFFEVNTGTDPITYNIEAHEARFYYYLYLLDNFEKLHEVQMRELKR